MNKAGAARRGPAGRGSAGPGNKESQTARLSVARVPCGSCPYRKDVPSGIWAKEEYDKLLIYDMPIIDQLMASAGAFMCHQRDGKLCAGWLACHGPNLATLRLNGMPGAEKYDPSVYEYETSVPLWESGAAARAHGLKDNKRPKVKARRMMDGLMRKGGVRIG